MIALVLCATMLVKACTPTPGRIVASATPAAIEPTLSISATPVPPPTPTPSATPRPAPTLDPRAVADRVAAGQVAMEAKGVDTLCLRWEDANADGEAEWIGLYLHPTDIPRLEAFVLDGGTWHELRAPENEEYGLGMYAACELDVQDVNDDGKVEILIRGRAEGNIDLLHIFVWDDVRYALLASFQGDAGIELENLDGELGREVIVRHNAGKGLAWEAIHTWDGASYGWTWEQYDWLHADRPHGYLTDDPEHVVISFYLALDDRDLPGSYSLLSSEVQSAQPYQTWAAGFDTTLAVEVGSVHQTAQTGDSATVTAQIRSYDNLDGYVVGRLWDTTWSLIYEGQSWRLQNATTEELDSWEATYFP